MKKQKEGSNLADARARLSDLQEAAGRMGMSMFFASGLLLEADGKNPDIKLFDAFGGMFARSHLDGVPEAEKAGMNLAAAVDLIAEIAAQQRQVEALEALENVVPFRRGNAVRRG